MITSFAPALFSPERPMQGLDPLIVAEVRRRLDAISSSEKVTIALAIESGSRAWGFPSPDSDYDCRFVFVRHKDEYLSLDPKRDVIETELTSVLDVNGWDLGKALKLLLKGNAVIIEWLMSPLTYRENSLFRTGFLDLAREVTDRNAISHHYFHLARQQYARVVADENAYPLKKLFYVLRPLVALRWLERNPQAAVAPMHFSLLCNDAGLDTELFAAIEELRLAKAATREMGLGMVPNRIRHFIAHELAQSEARLQPARGALPEHIALANGFYREWITRFSTG
jgi:uncharacterized protein